MKEQFVTYVIAKKLKELGFDEECLGSYFEWPIPDRGTFELSLRGTVPAPLWQQVIDWFREEYNLHIGITVNQFGYGFMFSIIDLIKYKCIHDLEGGPNEKYSYNKAREQAILKAIELCQKKK